MVKEGETGFMVDPDDHEGLAKRVLTLLRNPSLAKTFSVNGSKVAEEYSWEKVKEIIFKMYDLI
jgi:glycosyltransferase involved in cell wall biosynthesis